MNYKNVYQKLVTKRKNKLFEGYGENHHIIPRCLNGTDEPENMVRLTAREHFLAHQLLIKIYPNNRKLIHAAHLMMYVNQQKYNGRKYEWLQKMNSIIGFSDEHRQKIAKGRTGKKHTDETKEKISIKKQNPSDETRQNISKGQTGKILSDTHKQRISESCKGRTFSEETKRKLSESNKNKIISEETKRRNSEAAKLVWANRRAAAQVQPL